MSEYIITDEQVTEVIGHLPDFYVPTWVYKWAHAEKVNGCERIVEHVGSGLPEIVRCRDCKRFSLDNSDHDYRSGWWCHRWNTDMVKPDGFCAWGERRQA